MSRQSTAKRPVFSASAVLDAVASDLAQIKAEDRLTYADIGAVLGKSEDQAAKYCAGEADMGLVSYARGKREWNGRFTGSLERLCETSRPGKIHDQNALTALLDAATKLAKALEDGEIEPKEVRACRTQLEAARDAIDAQLGKLRPTGGVA
jgi:hypothetical protein